MTPAAGLRAALGGEGQPGYVVYPGFADPEVGKAMLDDVVGLARKKAEGGDVSPAIVTEETQPGFGWDEPEGRVSKIFVLHRRPAFRAFLTDSRIASLLAEAIGPDVDCFLSQFIFKLPGALGQPWHQDAFYFPFDRGPQVGAWLAVTDATPDNGPLWVLPGSHTEEVHRVVADSRENANFAYVEIVDHDMEGAIPVLLTAGDLLLFHSHLMHRSTDNASSRKRAAMVYHYGEAGTVDGSKEKFGIVPPNVDWMPVRRARS